MLCSICAKECVPTDGTPGYGTDASGSPVCFACCARLDRQSLYRGEPIALYFDGKEVTNWPGTLRIAPRRVKQGKHNIAGTRVSIWFRVEGRNWLGVMYGDGSLLRIREVQS